MIADLYKLSTPELLDLYQDRSLRATNGNKRMSLLSLSAAYFLVLGNFAPFKNNTQARFFNTLAQWIYDSNPYSILIQKAIEISPGSTKPQVIEKIGGMGIKNMNKSNFNKILSLYECMYILYNIYVKDTTCDLEELLANLQHHMRTGSMKENQADNAHKRKFFNVIGYYQFLCNKLNDNGFKHYDYDTGVVDTWKANKYFMASMNSMNPHHQKAFRYLKEYGYFNMGICPKCGGVMKDEKYTYYSTINPKVNYPICLACYNSRIRPSIAESENKKGCYIATVCYGDFNSKEVLAFRAYRDRVLCKSIMGRLFITLYYFFSPPVARYLDEKHTINHILKIYILDKIYRRISAQKDSKV